jgi:hypothetical protein
MRTMKTTVFLEQESEGSFIIKMNFDNSNVSLTKMLDLLVIAQLYVSVSKPTVARLEITQELNDCHLKV